MSVPAQYNTVRHSATHYIKDRKDLGLKPFIDRNALPSRFTTPFLHSPTYPLPNMRASFHLCAALLLTVLITSVPDAVHGSATAKAMVLADAVKEAPNLAREYGSLYSGLSDNFVQNGERSEFAISVVKHMMAVGYNAACIHPVSVGHRWDALITFEPKFRVGLVERTISYKCYVARRGQGMVVTNTGDGGFINWAYGGWGVHRDGGTVTFA